LEEKNKQVESMVSGEKKAATELLMEKKR